ncbi:MAG: metal ABC transporter ATP-binding protein [Elusimicrobiota bacterium]|jgi:zinc transport system ATP-binding protein|nr:metal ABC transporter ATP-binding protein [Elusimicrobiota bacterium]
MVMISFNGASFAYDDNIVLNAINFDIEEGAYLSIVGENGSGKSTLIKGLLGLQKPIKGKITISETVKIDDIGYMPQTNAVQKDFPASVYEVVLSGRLNKLGIRPFYSKKDKENALSNMEFLNILDIKNSCFRELSGGQQQRALLARALCAAHKLLVLDEPSSGLDPLACDNLYQALKDINLKQKIAIIMVSHDINRAVESADYILHLQNKQLFFGRTADYLKSDIGKFFTIRGNR